ncbi:uncharacterized protein FYW47_013446 [Aplochiton taeniatus]
MAESDAHMEELVDQGLGMEETAHSLQLQPGHLGQTYHSDALLASDTDFMRDDRSSAASGMDVADRLTYLEQKMQMQEDEIQLLKMALADVLKRLNISEEHQTGRKAPGVKARPVSLALPSRPPMVNLSAAALKKSTTLPSTITAKNFISSPTLSKSAVRSPAGSAKDSPCGSRTTKARPPSGASSCSKKASDSSSKDKDSAVSVGTRRVTHCKVTMQIYLSPLARRTGSSEATQSAPSVSNTPPPGSPTSSPPKGGAKPDTRKRAPNFHLPLQKTSVQSTNTSLDMSKTSGYKSPLKSPSQYFQICY